MRRVLRPGGAFLYADFRPEAALAGWQVALRDADFEIREACDLTPGVVAALDAEDDRKRALIASLIDRPLAGIFHEFAALRGNELYDQLRRGTFQLVPRVRGRAGGRRPTVWTESAIRASARDVSGQMSADHVSSGPGKAKQGKAPKGKTM
jgi:hypothetical protein